MLFVIVLSLLSIVTIVTLCLVDYLLNLKPTRVHCMQLVFLVFCGEFFCYFGTVVSVSSSVVVLGLGRWPWDVLEDKFWVLGLGLEGQVPWPWPWPWAKVLGLFQTGPWLCRTTLVSSQWLFWHRKIQGNETSWRSRPRTEVLYMWRGNRGVTLSRRGSACFSTIISEFVFRWCFWGWIWDQYQ